MPFECPLELPLQMTIPLNYLMPATSVFLKCIVNIQIQAICLQIIMEQLRGINNMWIGAAVIVSAGFYIIYRERKK